MLTESLEFASKNPEDGLLCASVFIFRHFLLIDKPRV